MTMSEPDLTLKNLNQYYGTEGYTKVMGINVTDGICYIMMNGYSFLVTDFLSLIVTNHKGLRDQEFLSIKLKLKGDGSKANMIVTDGNDNILYEQFYTYTNVKKEVNLFFTNEVLMLTGEY